MITLLATGITTAERSRMDSVVEQLLQFHQAYPIVGILLLMMALDVAIGLCAAIVTRSVSSTISQRGMTRKVIMLLLVGVGAVLDPYAGGIPLAKMIAMCFIVTEFISIVENSARAGVPVPQVMMDVLQKLRDNEKASVTNQGTNTVNIQRASNVEIKVPNEKSPQDPSIHSDSGITINQGGASK